MVAIFVLTMFLFFLSVDLIVLKIQGKYHPAFEPSYIQFDSSLFGKSSFFIPSDISFSKGHTWLKKDNKGLISIGIDEFGSMALGPVSILNCAAIGKELKRGEMIFEGAYGNRKVKFLSPINGIVKSVNENIFGKKISNPYETWGVQIVSDDFSKNKEMFVTGKEAFNWLKKESIKLKDFIVNHSLRTDLAGTTMLDGGSLSNDTISLLVDNSVNDFEKEFLSL
jgi:glycine cleavage system H lipoate-binding protein